MITPNVVFFALVAIAGPPVRGVIIIAPERLILICAVTLAMILAPQSVARLTVHADQPTVSVSPVLYGIFFEEINNAGDGGLYAEMARNRGFEDSDKPDHWIGVGSARIQVKSEGNGRYLALSGSQGAGVLNDGYWGMALDKGKKYEILFRARTGNTSLAEVAFGFQDRSGNWLVKRTAVVGQDWTDISNTVSPSKSLVNARLAIVVFKGSNVDLDDTSVFPLDTWKGRPNGNRPDLATMLDELKPAFVRFPGGCWVEGEYCANAHRWKTTIGDITKRRTQVNLWNYMSTNGLGYQEYLELCEDLGAEPLFVINCGMSHKEVVPLDKMNEYVQDALDAIEYANGPTSSYWGAQRALNGHPLPFDLKYVEIGNENGGKAYAERYPLFVKAIKAKYPNVKLVCNVWGGIPTSAPVEIVDEHYYSSPEFFIQNADKYDSYDRQGHKVYVGEYAVTQGCGNGNLRAALGEAAFMTGMERNSDIVVMSSYAPLFANVNAKNWNPDLIYFDSSRVCGTPSYYVQKMFSRNRPETIVKSELSKIEVKRGAFPSGGIGIGTWNTQSEFKDIKITKDSEVVYESVDGRGLKIESGKWDLVEGAIRQTSGETPARAWIGDSSMASYTLTLKARKLSGAEGFLITFGRRDEKNYLWWNIGGWGNSQGAIEFSKDGAKSYVGKQVASKVETGRWYDVRVDYSPDRIKCTLDSVVVYDESFPVEKPLYYVTGKTKTRELIVKVVNVSDESQSVDVTFAGVKSIGKQVSVETLTSKNPADENSVDNPKRVFPLTTRVATTGNLVRHTFPAHSVTVLRVKTQP